MCFKELVAYKTCSAETEICIYISEERIPGSFSWILSQAMSVVLSRYMTSRLWYVSALANCRPARVPATFCEHAVCGPLDNGKYKRRKLEAKEKQGIYYVEVWYV
jgi:hypothetical protein